MSIHKRIKQRREELGLSMQELADLVGVSAWQTVQQWEKEGGTAPKRDRLAAVAKALQTTPERLLFDNQQAEVLEIADALTQEVRKHSISDEAVKIAQAFDRLNSTQKAAVLAQLEAFGVLSTNRTR